MQSDDVTRPIEILSVLGVEEQQSLRAIVEHTNWSLANYDRLEDASAAMREREPSVVVCADRIETFYTWKDVLATLSKIKNPPQLVVSSRHPDDAMWSEILNYGAFDLLQTPYEWQEVIYSVSAASRRRIAAENEPTRTGAPIGSNPPGAIELVECESLDEQHRLEFRLSEQLRKAILSGSSNGLWVSEILDQLMTFSVVHFTTEETLMVRQGYPHIAAHRAQHDSARSRLAMLDTRFREGDRRAAFEILDFLDSFTREHIPTADRDLAAFLRNTARVETPAAYNAPAPKRANERAASPGASVTNIAVKLSARK
ncbi:MAG TPA: hemerythrin family protein [Bryobacteraceae bacterium]|nr:hemerythrin family protein [Bryobacteraceae bacterium]